MKTLKRILDLSRRQRRALIASVILLLAIIGTRLTTPYISKLLIDNVLTDGEVSWLLPLLGAMVGLMLIRVVMSYVRGFLAERVSQDAVFDLRQRMYNHLQELSYRFYDQHRIGEIMSRLTGDIDGIRGFIAGGLFSVIENLSYFVGSLFVLFSMQWQLALIALAIAPPLAFIALKFDKLIRPAFNEIREQNAVLNTRTQENLSGVRIVKAFAQEHNESDRFRVDNQLVLRKNLAATWIGSTYHPIIEIISAITSPLVLLAGGYMVVNGTLSLGTLVAFTNYLWMIANPMRQLGYMINMVEQAISSAEKIFYYIDLGTNIHDKEETRVPEAFAGHVRFENVQFRYGRNIVLEDINLDVPAGNTVAVMGATGTGKTSLVNLIGRFYDVTGGRVLVDGIDVRDLPLKELRRHIGFVMQETFLFSDSLDQNIALGRSSASMEEIVHAAEMAQANDFIQEIPGQYDTIVGERGMGLSGGQKQRVAIARALLIDPLILILDDSTSAVDMETEYEIQRALNHRPHPCTTFIIAHRISSVKNADEIIVLDQGHIAERGTHDSLMAKKGLYYGMYMDQYRDFEQMQGG